MPDKRLKISKNRILLLSFRAHICKRLMSPGIDSASLCSLGPSTTNRVIVPGRQISQAAEIDSLLSISGLLKRFQIRAQFTNRFSSLFLLVPMQLDSSHASVQNCFDKNSFWNFFSLKQCKYLENAILRNIFSSLDNFYRDRPEYWDGTLIL